MFEIWIRAIKPGLAVDKAVAAFETMLAEAPKPTLGTAVKWMAISGVIAGVFVGLINLIFGSAGGQLSGSLLLFSIGNVIVGPILSVIGFVIISVVMLGIAKALGGQGNLGNQSYMLAALSAPMSIILAALRNIPGLIGILIFYPVAIYAGWLSLLVLRAPHQYSGSRACLTVLLSYALIFGLFLTFSVIFFAALLESLTL